MLNYSPRLYCEAIEILKHQNNFNKKDEDLGLETVWYPNLRSARNKKAMSTDPQTILNQCVAVAWNQVYAAESLRMKFPNRC